MSEQDQAEARRRALPAIAAFRDGGCVLPEQPSPEVIREMMAFLGCGPVDERVVPMFTEDLHLDGADSGAVSWGDEVPADVRADAHTVVIGCGESGLLTGIRLAQAGVPFTIVEKNEGPGGTWWDNRYPGARVDIGSHFYCYSFEPSDHWTEYFAQQPELRDYFTRILDQYDIRSTLPLRGRGHRGDLRRGHRPVGRHRPHPRRGNRGHRRPVRGQCRRGPQPAQAARDRGHGGLRRSLVPLGTMGSRRRLEGHPVRPGGRRGQRFPDRPHHRRRRRAPHGVPTDGAVDVPERPVPLRGPGRGHVGHAPPAVLRPVVPVPHLLSGGRAQHGTQPDRPDLGRRRPFDQRRQRPDPRDLHRVDRLAARGPARPARGLRPALSAVGQADAPGQRLLARLPEEAERRARAHGHRAHRSRGHRDHRRHPPRGRRHLLRHRLSPQRLPLADGDHRSPRGDVARAVGRRAHRLPGHHRSQLPEPVLPLRAGHQPGPRRQPHLPVGVPGQLRA